MNDKPEQRPPTADLDRRRFLQWIGAAALPMGCSTNLAPVASTAKELLTAQPPPPPLPGLGTLGLGYDSYATAHRMRNRVLAFDYAVEPQPWVSAADGGLYHEPETDTRYAIPAGVGVDHERQRGHGRVTVAASRSHFESQFSESLEVSGSYGLFSASVDESFSMSSTADEQAWFCQRTQEVRIWTLWVAGDPIFDPQFVARIDALPPDSTNANHASYAAMIEDYGILVIDQVSLGGRIEYNAVNRSEGYSSSAEAKVGFEASYAANFDAKGSAEYGEQASAFNEQTDISVDITGGDASEAGMLMDNGGSTLEWSKTVSADPAVIESSYRHIYDVIPLISTSEDPASLPGKRDAMRRAVRRYGREHYPTVRLSVMAGVPSDGATVIKAGHASVIGSTSDSPGKRFPSIRVTVLKPKTLDVISDDYFIPYSTRVQFTDPTAPRQRALETIRRIINRAKNTQIVIVATCIAESKFGKTRAHAVLEVIDALRNHDVFAPLNPGSCSGKLTNQNFIVAGIKQDGGVSSPCSTSQSWAIVELILRNRGGRYAIDHG